MMFLSTGFTLTSSLTAFTMLSNTSIAVGAAAPKLANAFLFAYSHNDSLRLIYLFWI
jgi:hypothetical protein